MTWIIDYIALGVFALYSIGLLGLFGWVVRGAFKKEGGIDISAVLSSVRTKGDTASLSKLQIFIWTLVMVFAWLFRLVRDPEHFPVLPNQALLLMGISGATYIAAKQLGSRSGSAAKPPQTSPTPTQPPPDPSASPSPSGDPG